MLFNGIHLSNDHITFDGATEINKTISVSNQSLIFVKLFKLSPADLIICTDVLAFDLIAHFTKELCEACMENIIRSISSS